MNSLFQYPILKRLRMPFCLLVGTLVFALTAKAQEKPPRPISVDVVSLTITTAQPLSFGAIIPFNDGGTVTVDHTGFRTSTLDIILPNISSNVSPALFIVDAEPGTLITIVNGPTALLSGSNGGTLSLQLGESNVGNPFIIRELVTYVKIGGTLTIGLNGPFPAGNYNGTFLVTFIQQ